MPSESREKSPRVVESALLESKRSPVSPAAVEAGWEFLRTVLGSGFVAEYVVYDSASSSTIVPQGEPLVPHTFFTFRLESEDKPFVKGRMTFSLDEGGNLYRQFRVDGIPDCDHCAGECDFTVDEELAVQLASNAGLAPGIDGYDAGFEWSEAHLSYVWWVRATYERSETEAWGKLLRVDAHTGEIYGSLRSSWTSRSSRSDAQVAPN